MKAPANRTKRYDTAAEYWRDVGTAEAEVEEAFEAARQAVNRLVDVHSNLYNSMVWSNDDDGLRSDDEWNDHTAHIAGKREAGARIAARILNDALRAVKGEA